MKKGIFIITLLISAQAVLANGGPIETSPVLGGGEGGPDDFIRRDVEIVSEDLTFTPKVKFVDVDVRYVLFNYGEDLETGYCFPVTAINVSGEDTYNQNINPEFDVQDFIITMNGNELPVEFFLSEERDTVRNPYGYETQVSTHLYTTHLSIASGDTAVVDVSYSIRATYEDFQTTKNFFPSYQDRIFTYDLTPASWWGRGTAGTFTMTLNTEELHAAGGSMMDIPGEGEWIAENRFVFSQENFRLNSISPLYFAYESRLASDEEYIEQYIISPENYTVTVSSSLSGNYGAENLSDGDLTTTWSEGAEGTTGEWILLEFNEGVNVAWVGIAPGYMKGKDVFRANAKPATLAVECTMRDGDYSDIEIHNYVDTGWMTIEKGFTREIFQEVFNRGESYPIESLLITVEEAIPGEKFEDLCISEIIVAGWTYPL